MSWMTERYQGFFSKGKKTWGWLTDWRKTDSLLRGISRGISIQTLINAIGKLSGKNLALPANISVIPTTLFTIYTSYSLASRSKNTDDNLDELYLTDSSLEESSLLAKKTKKISEFTLLSDAIARGISRADAVIALTNLLGTAIQCDLEITAVSLGLVALILGSWSSYQMSSRGTPNTSQNRYSLNYPSPLRRENDSEYHTNLTISP